MSNFAYLVFIPSYIDAFQLLDVRNDTGAAVLIWGLECSSKSTGYWLNLFSCGCWTESQFPVSQGTLLAPRYHPWFIPAWSPHSQLGFLL